jgi:hypothetical protein
MYSKLTYHRQKKWRIQEGHGLGQVFMFAILYIYIAMNIYICVCVNHGCYYIKYINHVCDCIYHGCANIRRDDQADALAQPERRGLRDTADIWSESECKSCDIMAWTCSFAIYNNDIWSCKAGSSWLTWTVNGHRVDCR